MRYFAAPEPTLSQGKTATASSTNGSNAAGNALDGNPSTKWSSSGDYPQWWMVDLGTKSNIGCVRIQWTSGKDVKRYLYKIEVSDNNSSGFTTVSECKINHTYGITEDILACKGQYVRITVTGSLPQPTSAQANFMDVKIYENKSTVNLNVNPLKELAKNVRIVQKGSNLQITLPFTGKYTAALFDICGRQILNSEGSGPDILTFKNRVCSGSYVLTVKTGNQEIRRKVVVR